jgi:hypothetical protein
MADSKISELPAAALPLAGTELIVLVQDGATVQATIDDIPGTGGGGGSGDVTGPGASVDNAIARMDGTTGKIIQSSIVTISDTGVVAGILNLTASGVIQGGSFTGSVVGLSGTKAELDAVCSNGNLLYVGDITQYTDEMAQDAVGAMVNTSLTYVDGGPQLGLTPRTINGVTYDGTANITIPSANRVVTLTDPVGASPAIVSVSAATTDVGILTALSQNSTIANPSGSPTDTQRLTLRIKSTTSRTLTWGSKYRGSDDLPLPSATTGSSKTDYLGFQYNSADDKWDYVAKNFGF